MNTRRDTNRQRIRQALRPLSVAVRRLALYPRLHLYRVNVPDGPLYAAETVSAARALVNQTFSGPAYWKLERGECGGLHLHVVSPLPPVAVPGAAHHVPVHDLGGLLAYLSKPADARLCRPGRLSPWSMNPYARAQAYRDGLDDYAQARRDALSQGRRRLPALSGWTGPNPRAAPPPVLLVLACLRLRLLGVMPPAPERAGHARRAERAVRASWCGVISTHPPPRIGQAQAR